MCNYFIDFYCFCRAGSWRLQKRSFKHTVFLLSIAADSLARQRWLPDQVCKRSLPVAGVCLRVLLRLGPCTVGDAKLQVSDNLQHSRARAVEAGKVTTRMSGCNRYLEFLGLLSYVSTQMCESCPSLMQVSLHFCPLAG